MKKLVMTFFVSFAALGLSIGDAEARRMGGGKSVGMQRQAIAPKPATPPRQHPNVTGGDRLPAWLPATGSPPCCRISAWERRWRIW